MPVSLTQVQNLNVGVCEVTLTSPDDSLSVSFDCKYNKNVPPQLFIALMEMPLLAKQLETIGSEIQKLSEVELSNARVVNLQEKFNQINVKLNQLPKLLAGIVLWQDITEKPEPDEDFFISLGLEKCIEYASCLTQAKQRPTVNSVIQSPPQSTQAESAESTLIKQDVSGLPDGSGEMQSGATTTTT